MNRLTKYIATLLFIILFVMLYKYVHRHSVQLDATIGSEVLKPNEKEKFIINNKTHTLTTVTEKGTTRQFTSDKDTSITVLRDGTIHTTNRSFGTELGPFIGFSYSDRARLALGVDVFYWQRWNLGVALLPYVSGSFSLRGVVLVSYNVYSNTSLFVGVDNTKSPVGGISFKF